MRRVMEGMERRRRMLRIGTIRVGDRLGRIGIGREYTEEAVSTMPISFCVETRYHSDSMM
jgi:hypothetical protein